MCRNDEDESELCQKVNCYRNRIDKIVYNSIIYKFPLTKNDASDKVKNGIYHSVFREKGT